MIRLAELVAVRLEQAGNPLAHRLERRRVAHVERPALDRRQLVDYPDLGAADPEEIEHGAPRGGHGKHCADGDDRGRYADQQGAPAPERRGPLLLDPASHRAGEVRRPRQVELAAELHKTRLELAHAVTPSSARSRSSARESLDFTVPRRTPSAAAVSSSDSSRK